MSTFIFDFDGTIADSFDYAANFLAAETGQAPLSAIRLNELKGLSMIAMARKLGCGWWKLPKLFYKGRRLMRKNIKHIPPFAGMPDLIRKLHSEGHELFILSSNTVGNIHDFLHQYQMHKYFLEIYGGVGLFGKAKALHRLQKTHKLETEACTYIGDEIRDVEAAKSIGMAVVAVTWGFAKDDDLIRTKPTVVVDSPAELMSYLEVA